MIILVMLNEINKESIPKNDNQKKDEIREHPGRKEYNGN